MNLIDNLKKDIENSSSRSKAKILQRFFKTGKGEYGEGDLFLGITVPQSREIAKKYSNLDIISSLDNGLLPNHNAISSTENLSWRSLFG